LRPPPPLMSLAIETCRELIFVELYDTFSPPFQGLLVFSSLSTTFLGIPPKHFLELSASRSIPYDHIDVKSLRSLFIWIPPFARNTILLPAPLSLSQSFLSNSACQRGSASHLAFKISDRSSEDLLVGIEVGVCSSSAPAHLL